MSSFFTFLDDIAVLAKATAAGIDDIAAGASKAASKSAAVVIDDAAVTPQYVQGISPARELPIIAAITKRSLINKAIIIAAIMVLTSVAPWVFPWALIVGGCYLAYEGAERITHRIVHKNEKPDTAEKIIERPPEDETSIIKSAATTDFVLSAEIMLISVDSLESTEPWMQFVILLVVAVLMTALVYGSVGLLVKVDDTGRWLAERGTRKPSAFLEAFGVGLVKAMPKVFSFLTVVGVAAMLWVGGHLLVVNLGNVGLPLFADIAHNLTHGIANDFLFWGADSLLSACFGFVAGMILVGVFMFAKKFGNARTSS